MDLDLDILRKCALFRDVSDKGIEAVLNDTGYTLRRCDKGEGLITLGYENTRLGILLSGRLQACKTDSAGSSFIVSHIPPCGIFGDVLALSSYAKSPVDLRAECSSSALLLNVNGLYNATAAPSAERMRVLRNLTECIADKYFMLDSRLELLLEKSLRAKIVHMLSHDEYERGGYAHSTRSELAAYLNCERSALSRELARMQSEGIIRCKGREILLA